MSPSEIHRYLTARDIRALAEIHGVTPSKSRGQNFLFDANTIRKIVQTAGVRDNDHVLEVGPGFGSLTVGLLDAGARVTSIEVDERLVTATRQVVTERFPQAACEVIHADALQMATINPDITHLVANLPYNVAVPVVLHLLGLHPGFSRVLVMVQAEVGYRLAATPGTKEYGAPSVKASWWGEWSVEATVSRKVFWPEPRVDSVLVGMQSGPPPGDDHLRAHVFSLVDEGFGNRRKMARQAFAGRFGGVEHSSRVIEGAGLEPTSRCETWTLDDFVRMSESAARR